MQCPSCRQEIHNDALVCPFCQRDTPVGLELRHKLAERRHTLRMLWVAFGLGLIGGILIIFVVASTPSSYDEIARDYERACLANNGWGDWDWSSGMSLEQFCNDAGALYAHELEKRDHHPE